MFILQSKYLYMCFENYYFFLLEIRWKFRQYEEKAMKQVNISKRFKTDFLTDVSFNVNVVYHVLLSSPALKKIQLSVLSLLKKIYENDWFERGCLRSSSEACTIKDYRKVFVSLLSVCLLLCMSQLLKCTSLFQNFLQDGRNWWKMSLFSYLFYPFHGALYTATLCRAVFLKLLNSWEFTLIPPKRFIMGMCKNKNMHPSKEPTPCDSCWGGGILDQLMFLSIFKGSPVCSTLSYSNLDVVYSPIQNMICTVSKPLVS